MSDATINPSVANALESIGGLSTDMAGALGAPPVYAPPAPALGRPPKGGPYQTNAAVAGAEAKVAAEQDKQALTEAQAAKGLNGHAAKKFPWLTGKVPGAQRVRVRQRNGAQLVTIGDYSKSDVESSPDIESFVNTYLRPQYGGGEYQIFLIDEIGKEMDGGIIRFPDPAKNPYTAPVAAPDPALGMMPLMVEMYRNSTKPVPDPFQQMKTMKEFLMDTAPKNDDSTLAMMMQMQQQSMQMQMQMQQTQQNAQAAAQQQMIALLTQKPAVDPAMTAITALLERMDRRLEKLETAPPPPPPPMMPSKPDYSMPELLTAIGTVVSTVVPLIKNESGPSAVEMAGLIIQAQQAARPTDGLGVRDVIDIFREREASASPPATLEEQIGTFVRVKELASALVPPSGPQQKEGTTFWDAAVAILGPHSEISRAIGQRVDQTLQQKPQPQHVEITHNRQVQQNTGQPNVQPAGNIPPQASEPETVPLPADFSQKMEAMEKASSPGERIEAAVNAVLSLRGIDHWNTFTQNLMFAVAGNDLDTSMNGLGDWFGMLVRAKMLTRQTGLATLHAFKTHFKIVREGMLEKIPQLKAIPLVVPLDAVEQAAAPVEGAAPETAKGEGEEPDSEEPKPTGPPPEIVDLGHDNEVNGYAQGAM